MLRPLLVAALCTGCAADSPDCIEYHRTITHGVYGAVKLVETNGDIQPLTKVPITITRYIGGYVDLHTDEHGLYEVAVPDGDYSVCTEFLDLGCHPISIGGYYASALLRVDLDVQEGVSVDWDRPDVGGCP